MQLVNMEEDTDSGTDQEEASEGDTERNDVSNSSGTGQEEAGEMS